MQRFTQSTQSEKSVNQWLKRALICQSEFISESIFLPQRAQSIKKKSKNYDLKKLFFTFNKIPKVVVPKPKGKKITAPVAHFESIEFAHNITAENIQIIPITPIVNIIISFGNFGKKVVLMYFKYSPITIGNNVIKKGYKSNFIICFRFYIIIHFNC